MKSECMKAVEQVIGRALGKGEADRIEERLSANLRDLARTDKAFAGLSTAERLKKAAERSMEQDIAQATKGAQRKALSAAAQVRETTNLAARAKELGGKNPLHGALFERLRQVDQYVTGVKNEIFGNLVDAMKASAPKFLGLIENGAAVRDFVREVYGIDTGNEVAAKGAKVYLEQIEHIRQRMNSAGADIGKLDYGYLPQPHDTGAIVKAGKADWVAKTLQRLERSRYFNTDGTAMNDAQMGEFLAHAYDTLATEGLIRREPGAMSQGSRASRADEAHRSLHFKDPESYLGYLADFGSGSVFEAIHNHVNMQGKSIGLMESFGSNPNATYQLMRDTAQIEDSRSRGKAVKNPFKSGYEPVTTDMVWDVLNGTTANPVNPTMAAVGRFVRNWQSATKLGGIMLSSINDTPTWVATARYNGIPLGKAFGTMMQSLSSSHIVDDAARLGIAVESIAGEMQTWHADNMRQDWSGKLANSVMKLQLVESWTHRLRAGLGLMLQDQLATMKEKSWGSLSEFDRNRMKTAGVTEGDWQVWQAATPEEIRGRPMLTAKAIRNTEGFTDAQVNQAVAKMLGFIDNEGKTAVIGPDIGTRSIITQGTRAGTLGGEFGRSLMLFKSFPLAVAYRNIERIKSIPTVQGKIAYSAALMTGLTIMGAISVELKDIFSGKNPRDATTPKFWGAAFSQGGGLGIFGDMLYTGLGGNSRGGQPNWTSLGGPVLGTAADLANVTIGNLGQVLQGKDPKAAAEALRFTRQNLPFLNLWYAKAAIDHAGFNDLQEQLSPGYLARQRAAQRRDWGSSGYWYEPNEALPTGLPDLTTAAGN